MKKALLFLVVPVLAFGLASCGSEEHPDPGNTADTTAVTPEVPEEPAAPEIDLTAELPGLPADYVEHDLTEFGFAGVVSAPEGASIYNSTLFTNDGEQEQIVVQMSDDSNLRVNIFESTKDFAAAVVDVEGSTINEFQSYLIEDENAKFFYAKKFIDESAVFNFALVFDTGNGFYHCTGNGGMEDLTKEDALLLFAIAKSMH